MLSLLGKNTLKAIGVAVMSGGLFAVAYPVTRYLTANPRFVLGSSSEGKGELLIQTQQDAGGASTGLITPGKATITINGETLKAGDILCEDDSRQGNYFLIRPTGNRALEYKLENGNIVSTCRKTGNNVPTYYLEKLSGTNSYGHFPSKIAIGSCNIENHGTEEKKYKITCKEFENNQRTVHNRSISFIMSFKTH